MVLTPPTAVDPPVAEGNVGDADHPRGDVPAPAVDSLDLGTDTDKYKSEFAHRGFCPVVSVDMPKLLASTGYDMSEHLGQFEKLLKVSMSYSPTVVRHFYCNLESFAVYSGGSLRSRYLETSVRGKSIRLTPADINALLGTENIAAGQPKPFKPERIHQLLSGREDYPGHLKLKPTELSDHIRVIHYIYSRCLVNKCLNYSHLNDYDYPVLASIAAKEKRDVGVMIFDEMQKVVDSKSVNTPLPYPQLVSYILSAHNIQFMEDGDEVCAIPEFDKSHLARLRIPLAGASTQPPSEKGKGKGKGKEEAAAEPGPAADPAILADTLKEAFAQQLANF